MNTNLNSANSALSLLRSTKLFCLPAKVSFADIYRVTADLTYPRAIFVLGKAIFEKGGNGCTTNARLVGRGKRALHLTKYAMAALILQRAGDVAVLLNPRPECVLDEINRCDVSHSDSGNFKFILNCSGMKFADGF